MTSDGGANGDGNIFSINTDGSGFRPAVVYRHQRRKSRWQFDAKRLNALRDDRAGGANGDGNIFSVNTDGTGFQNLLSFSGTSGAVSAHTRWQFDAQRLDSLWDDTKRRRQQRWQHFPRQHGRQRLPKPALV